MDCYQMLVIIAHVGRQGLRSGPWSLVRLHPELDLFFNILWRRHLVSLLSIMVTSFFPPPPPSVLTIIRHPTNNTRENGSVITQGRCCLSFFDHVWEIVRIRHDQLLRPPPPPLPHPSLTPPSPLPHPTITPPFLSGTINGQEQVY